MSSPLDLQLVSEEEEEEEECVGSARMAEGDPAPLGLQTQRVLELQEQIPMEHHVHLQE